MKVLLYSGLLYLAGVAIVLILQPSIMFTEEGIWKEFGIGRNSNTHTWLPFWLFAMVWALLSYIIVLILAGSGSLPGTATATGTTATGTTATGTTATGTATAASVPQTQANLTMHSFELPKQRGKRSNSLIPGYYILNREASELQGTPKYIYLGPEPPGHAE
jgi:hypothetical protein